MNVLNPSFWMSIFAEYLTMIPASVSFLMWLMTVEELTLSVLAISILGMRALLESRHSIL